MYYWNTTFSIDSIKREFLVKHNVKKMYVRYFDVVPDENGGQPKPNATIQFGNVPPPGDIEIIPVVFVLPSALDSDLDMLGSKILRRVKQMSETHRLGTVRELQIDCDWTTSTRNSFYRFMELLKQKTADDGIVLSSTIRLHQLADPPPPADRGVLMVYNTGDLRDMDKQKPILDPLDVFPYLKYLEGYELPLSSAYPVYRWELLFRNGHFVDIVHSPDELPILASDSIVIREPSADDILKCRHEIEMRRPECASEIILFDLNNYNIHRYDDQTFEKFYN